MFRRYGNILISESPEDKEILEDLGIEYVTHFGKIAFDISLVDKKLIPEINNMSEVMLPKEKEHPEIIYVNGKIHEYEILSWVNGKVEIIISKRR